MVNPPSPPTITDQSWLALLAPPPTETLRSDAAVFASPPTAVLAKIGIPLGTLFDLGDPSLAIAEILKLDACHVPNIC